ncbi:MAG: hypothetical protein ACREJB_02565, partial [Planctomycetaceae bacterium]
MNRLPCILALLLAPSVTVSAAEPWADPALPVSDGLFVWLDASRQNAARQVMKRPRLSDGAPVEQWHDGSGGARHVVQQKDEAQPRFHAVGDDAVIRFDGRNDALQWTGPGGERDEVTVFLVANPYVNPGNFRGFLALSAEAKNDYTSGLTIDLGPGASQRFETLNPEGVGFGGARDAMSDAFDFGTFHRITLVAAAGEGAARLFIDGELSGRRDRAPSKFHMDRLTVGARFVNNAGPPHLHGFLEGDIAEVLVYNRA